MQDVDVRQIDRAVSAAGPGGGWCVTRRCSPVFSGIGD